MAWLKKQIFGRKTEQTSAIMDGGTQLSLFGNAQSESAPVQEETVTVPEHKRKKKRTHDDWMGELPIEEVEYREEHPVCEKCGALLDSRHGAGKWDGCGAVFDGFVLQTSRDDSAAF